MNNLKTEEKMCLFPSKLPEAVFFDWDNTLVNTWDTIHRAINLTQAKFNKPLWTLDECRNKILLSAREYFPEVFGKDFMEAQEFFYKIINQEHLNELTACTGALNVIKIFKDFGIKTAVISNKRSDILKKEICHLDWENYFLAAIGSGDSLRDKPSPDPVYEAINIMGIPSHKLQNCWFIGDSEVDYICATNAGCIPFWYGKEQTNIPCNFYTLPDWSNFLENFIRLRSLTST